jgi:hypothetical protein
MTDHDEAATRLHERIQKNALTAMRIAQPLIESERELMGRKWFDYRFMTPMDATDYFITEYGHAFRDYWDRHIDRNEGRLKIGVGSIHPTINSAELTGFWRARQFADQLGVPYRLFLNWANNGFAQNGWPRVPRPNQLYAARVRSIVSAEVMSRWDAYGSHLVRFSSLPQYKVAHFRNLPAQKAHQDWVVRELKRRHARPYLLTQACFAECVLPIDRAVLEFGNEAVETARREPDAKVKPSDFVSGFDFLPGCFGVPGVRIPTMSQCDQCRLVARCGVNGASAATLVMSITGVSDPVESRRREQGRTRTQRSRERSRAAAGSSLAGTSAGSSPPLASSCSKRRI